MPKRIIDISSDGGYLRVSHQQLMIERDGKQIASIPIEDLAALILDHPQLIITQVCLNELLARNVMVITSDRRHMPVGMFLPLASNTLQTERFNQQATLPKSTCKRLWQQIIRGKVMLQGKVLNDLTGNHAGLLPLAKKVRSGDPENIEAQAARRYWSRLFSEGQFKRDRFAEDQNRFLNYGYAILRALTARSICGAGLHPGVGLHHHNRYNAYCLADDLMEPYRPIVDLHVYDLIKETSVDAEMNQDVRQQLLKIVSYRLQIDSEIHDLQSCLQQTAQSLSKVIMGHTRELILPKLA